MYKNEEEYNDPIAGEATSETDKIDSCILTQLCSLKKEREDIRRRIDKLSKEIDKMNKEGYYVTDYVTCGKKGKKPLGTRIIAGFPYPEYEKKTRYKKVYLNQLQRAESKIDKSICQAEKYIESISNSRTRRIVRYKCLDDSLSWVQIAQKMGKPFTPESCRSAYLREIGMKK